MFLDSAQKSLELVLGSAQVTTPMQIVVAFTDKAGEHETAGSSLDFPSAGTTPVTILPAAASSANNNIRTPKEISVVNTDTIPNKVIIRLNNNGTVRQIYACTLQVGDMLGYTIDDGWYVNDANGNKKTIAGAVVATSGLVSLASATAPDIFGAAGATISIDNSTPVTTTSFTACTSAQVGSMKRVIPVQNWSVTASANLVIDGATSGTFVMPAGAKLEVLASTTTLFQLTTIYASGTWTPNQGSGLTLVGAFSSSGIFRKSGNITVVNFTLTGATSVAAAGNGFLCTNLPFTSGSNFSLGMGVSSATGVDYGMTVGIATTIAVQGGTAIPATPSIFYQITY